MRELLTSEGLTPPERERRQSNISNYHLSSEYSHSGGAQSVSSVEFLAHLFNIFFKVTWTEDLTGGYNMVWRYEDCGDGVMVMV